MRKVLKFVKGKRDEKKDHGAASLGPFSMEITTPSPCTPNDDDHYMPFEQGCGYIVDISGKDKSVTKLHKAAWVGNLDKLKSSLKKVDIDAVDRLNRTALHLAAARGNSNLVWFLLNNKAKTNICDDEGRTPFLKAIECGHKDVVKLMIERGTDLNTVDYSGNSCLHIAAKHGFYDISTILLKQGGNFETSNTHGEFPIHIATCAEYRELVELMLRYNSSVNVVDRDNRSPLMFAARNGNMMLVQLFLENGAQRRVMDSNDWTAEDYALQAGHLDIAAELKSPSDLVDQGGSSDLLLEPISLPKNSISPYANKREDKERDADSDTWESQPSESSLKCQNKCSGAGLMKFLPPPSDDEISEESIQSPRADAKDSEGTQDSPRSCVIPPPCGPLRSWDLIQAGIIDDHQMSTEPRRMSLLNLGSLRQKRESFTESPNAQSPNELQGGQGDGEQWVMSRSFIKQDSVPQSHRHSFASDRSFSNGKESPQASELENEGKMSKQVNSGIANVTNDSVEKKSCESDSGSDWDSDSSLPLDNFPVHIPSKPLSIDRVSPIIVLQPSEDVFIEPDENKTACPVPSDKKSRFLLRVPPIDLTDEDIEFGKGISEGKQKSENNFEKDKNTISSSIGGTFGRDGTLQGYEEMWESNAHLSASNGGYSGPSSNSAALSMEEILADKDLSTDKLKLEDELLYSSPHLPEKGKNSFPEKGPSSAILLDHPLKTSTSLEFKKQTLATFLEGKNNKLNYESHSLDNLDDDMPKPLRKHFRQMSVSTQSWKSEEIYRKPTLPPPSIGLDRMLPDNKRISAQLECYDEALRELAQVTVIKKQAAYTLPMSNVKEPHSSLFAGAKKQKYLSLPRTNELIDEAFKEMGQTSVNGKTMQRGSLSLPRTATPKDMIELNHSSSMSSRTSSSLPRTSTPKDLLAGAEPVPPPRRRRRSMYSSKKAGSDGEFKKLREFPARPLSLDIKSYHKIEATIVKLPQPHKISVENIISEKPSMSYPRDENRSPNSSDTSHSSNHITNEKPIRKKRKMLLAMRGLNHQSISNSQSSVASVEQSFEDPPFWMSTDRKDGQLPRQTTVIERTNFSRTVSGSPLIAPPTNFSTPKESISNACLPLSKAFQSTATSNNQVVLDEPPDMGLPPPPPPPEGFK